MSRPRWLAIVATAGALGLIGAACGTSSSAGSANAGGAVAQIKQVSGSAQTNGHYPGAVVNGQAPPKPTVSLTDTAGQPYDVATETPGKVTLLYFGYTHCPDVCPINMALAATAIAKLPPADRAKVVTVFITTDPDRDTPAVLRAWLNQFDSNFVGLTGSIAGIHAAEQSVGMPLSEVAGGSGSDYQIEHAGYILAYSGDGMAHLTFYDTATVSQFATSLERLIAHGYQA